MAGTHAVRFQTNTHPKSCVWPPVGKGSIDIETQKKQRVMKRRKEWRRGKGKKKTHGNCTASPTTENSLKR